MCVDVCEWVLKVFNWADRVASHALAASDCPLDCSTLCTAYVSICFSRVCAGVCGRDLQLAQLQCLHSRKQSLCRRLWEGFAVSTVAVSSFT